MKDLIEALDLIPTHILLKEGAWRDGDEFWDHKLQFWHEIQGSNEPDFINPDNFTVCRRAIPEEVLESRAFWLYINNMCQTWISFGPLNNMFDDWGFYCDKVREYEVKFKISREKSQEIYEHLLNEFLNNFEEKEVIDLGGKDNIVKHFSQGNIYAKWEVEQMGIQTYG